MPQEWKSDEIVPHLHHGPTKPARDTHKRRPLVNLAKVTIAEVRGPASLDEGRITLPRGGEARVVRSLSVEDHYGGPPTITRVSRTEYRKPRKGIGGWVLSRVFNMWEEIGGMISEE